MSAHAQKPKKGKDAPDSLFVGSLADGRDPAKNQVCTRKLHLGPDEVAWREPFVCAPASDRVLPFVLVWIN